MGDFTAWSRDLRVTADADGVASLVGAVPLRMLADRSGLTAGLSGVLARRGFVPVHDRGRVLTDVAVMIACGGRDIVDVEALRAQGAVFGPVASDTTVLRALGEIGTTRPAAIARVRAAARAHMWSRLPGGRPPESTFAGGMSQAGTVVLRIDGSLVVSHSKKDRAAGTFKGTYGHHPLGCWIDNSGELASLMLRNGNAGANTAADLIAVLADAIGQVPKPHRARLLVTSDGAGTSHALIDWLTNQNHAADRSVEYSVGFDVDADVRSAIRATRRDCWIPAVDNATGAVRGDMDVAEITALLRDRLDRTSWPKTMRVFVRRRRLAAGEKPALFHLRGYKYSAFVTNTTTLTAQLLDARHRAHARVEDGVRTTKDTGLGHLPSKSWAVNSAWCVAITIAVDLLAWLRLLGCRDLGALSRAEPKTLRHRILAVPARIVRGQRRRTLRLPRHWPWSAALVQIINTIRRLPLARPG
ncbi:IS1380 family transposase [Dactylosporangium sp. CA-092794]|uniref:IS1380 family transposase n=1 Tax=Dactylosporangium sp. CA-092794 TaxID=3239929 RepID=UPI003D8BEFF1